MTRVVFGESLPPELLPPSQASRSRRDAPLRRIVRFVGRCHAGTRGGIRLRFELECGHVMDCIPYQRFEIAAAYRHEPHTRYRVRCGQCADEEMGQ